MMWPGVFVCGPQTQKAKLLKIIKKYFMRNPSNAGLVTGLSLKMPMLPLLFILEPMMRGSRVGCKAASEIAAMKDRYPGSIRCMTRLR